MTVEGATLLFVGCVVLLTVLLSVNHSQSWLFSRTEGAGSATCL